MPRWLLSRFKNFDSGGGGGGRGKGERGERGEKGKGKREKGKGKREKGNGKWNSRSGGVTGSLLTEISLLLGLEGGAHEVVSCVQVIRVGWTADFARPPTLLPDCSVYLSK